MEPRRVRAPSVPTPREDIVAQAGIARQQGLKVLLGPQFNMEMVAGGLDAVCRSHSRQWLEGWLREAERFWMWNALLAQEIGAEAMVLPGYCFHVFSSIDDTAEYSREFDASVASLVGKVREVFTGKLIISGSAPEFDFPGLADWVGATTFDTGHPELPAEATVDELVVAYEALFTQKLDPVYQRWGKPVIVYGLHLPVVTGERDPSGQEAQARHLEAIFQVLDRRSWIVGTLSWSYSMLDAPLSNDHGVRARLAEAVLAKYYGIYTGAGSALASLSGTPSSQNDAAQNGRGSTVPAEPLEVPYISPTVLNWRSRSSRRKRTLGPMRQCWGCG